MSQSASSTCYDRERWRGIVRQRGIVRMLVHDNELDLLADLHTKTNLGERRVPVGR